MQHRKQNKDFLSMHIGQKAYQNEDVCRNEE